MVLAAYGYVEVRGSGSPSMVLEALATAPPTA